jgi:hypothetical protein
MVRSADIGGLCVRREKTGLSADPDSAYLGGRRR